MDVRARSNLSVPRPALAKMVCGFAALNAIAETTRKRANFAARQASAFHRNGGFELEKSNHFAACRPPRTARMRRYGRQPRRQTLPRNGCANNLAAAAQAFLPPVASNPHR